MHRDPAYVQVMGTAARFGATTTDHGMRFCGGAFISWLGDTTASVTGAFGPATTMPTL
ncbi:hypothetical protein [Chondromyces apiculatus]|uniref:Uncharacterized protein n=1 Tax=Chondromyces apiculatus DSM 436 TaxID=1192034 RepID=A0A017TDD6_9BACT|nr:hypothetical protein [Chondromyces apiculatus]EYF07254.1 Hypothetical protein CAP_0733 [Chondromyces apiculatus DSM 436]